MRRFGKAWSPHIEEVAEARTPVGILCAYCDSPIADGDQGLLIPLMMEGAAEERPWHLDCFLEAIGIRKEEKK